MSTSHYRCDHIGCNARLPYFAVKESRWFIQGEHCLCATHRTRAHRYKCECKYPGKTTATLPPMCSTCRMDTRWEHVIEAEFLPSTDKVFPASDFSYDVIAKHSELLKRRLQRDLDARMLHSEQYPPVKVKMPPFYRHPPDSEVKFGSIFDAIPFIVPLYKPSLPSWGMRFKCVEDDGPMLRFVPVIVLGGVGYFCTECGHRDDNVVAPANCIDAMQAKTCPKGCGA